jgi:hypothetical protein
LTNVRWVELARTATVPDTAAFIACVSLTTTVPAIERDIKALNTLGGQGTPTIVIDSLMLGPLPDSSILDGIVRRILTRQDRTGI